MAFTVQQAMSAFMVWLVSAEPAGVVERSERAVGSLGTWEVSSPLRNTRVRSTRPQATRSSAGWMRRLPGERTGASQRSTEAPRDPEGARDGRREVRAPP